MTSNVHKLQRLVLIASTTVFLSACSWSLRPLPLSPLPNDQFLSDKQAQGQRFAIATQGQKSSVAALQMFERGGNAVDAFVAASFTLSVERPQSTGLGGGGFLLYQSPKMDAPLALDFRETAPAKATADMYLDQQGEVIAQKSLNGIHAVATPGLVAGLLEFHEKYGKLPRAVVMWPAIDLAENGLIVYPELEKALNYRAPILAQYPASKKIFLHPNGSPLKTGQRLIQMDLGKTLRKIAAKGKAGFYEGSVAEALIKTSRSHGGELEAQDLKNYLPKYRAPVRGRYRGHDIYSMSPPSSGGIHVVQILNILEDLNLRKMGPGHPLSIHYTTEAMRQAFADRSKYLGDPDFEKIPNAFLLSKVYAASVRSQFKSDKARSATEVAPGIIPPLYESDETTHLTIADSEGNVVSSTQTINGLFGSALVAAGTGIVLNNEMDDFAAKVGASNLFGALGGEKNLIAPGKRPLSSMSPTLVLKNQKPIFALGTPSGTRILTCVAQTLMNLLEYEMELYPAVATLRYHHQWSPDSLRIGPPGLDVVTEENLTLKGYKIEKAPLGCKVQAVAIKDAYLEGVSDPRGEGLVLAR